MLVVGESKKLKKLLKSNATFRSNFEGLCEKFTKRVIVWTPEVCFLAKRLFQDLLHAYKIDATVEIQKSLDGHGRFTINIHSIDDG